MSCMGCPGLGEFDWGGLIRDIGETGVDVYREIRRPSTYPTFPTYPTVPRYSAGEYEIEPEPVSQRDASGMQYAPWIIGGIALLLFMRR